MILDTQFLGQLQAQDTDAKQKARELDALGLPLRIPAAVVWEIYYGVGNAPSGSKIRLQRAYQRLFIAKPVVELDENIARRAGILRGVHRNSNRKKNLDGADSIVAATGLAYNEPVVSNDSDFQHVDGLTVETY